MHIAELPDPRAGRDPDGPCTADDTSELDNAGLLGRVRRAAAALRARGVGRGDVVALGIVKASGLPVDQLTRLYGAQTAELVLHQGLAWRAMHSHGRALGGLLPRAVDDVEAYDVREGEMVAGVVLGWNFGDGHLHNEQLLATVQERCGFAPGDLRVIVLESQPTHRQRQHYRIVDAATGPIEEGYVTVRDMVARQPWLDDEAPAIPVEPLGAPRPRTEAAAAHE